MNGQRVVFFAEMIDLCEEACSVIRESGAVLIQSRTRDQDEIAVLTREADAVMTALVPVREAPIAWMERCKVIASLGVGYDQVDVQAAHSRGITVTHVPDYCTNEVADHAIALALALQRELFGMDRRIRGGGWMPDFPYPMRPLRELTFAVIGCGRIGRATMERARAFRCRLIACDPYVPEPEIQALGVRRVTLQEALDQADILSIHTPLTDETRGLIGGDALSRMKSSAILVNTARGAVVDTYALAEALERRQIGAAGIDVFEEEPLPADHPLRRCERAILTPHWAWHSSTSTVRLQVLAAEEAVRGLRGQPPRCPVPDVG